MSDRPFFSTNRYIMYVQAVFCGVVIAIVIMIAFLSIVNPDGVHGPEPEHGQCFDGVLVYKDHVDNGFAAAGCK